MDREAFNRGVTEALTLAPLRRRISWRYDQLVSWHYTRRLFGERCAETEPGCPCCDKWIEHDWLFNDGPAPEDT